MITREINNIGAPLATPSGQVLAGCTLIFLLVSLEKKRPIDVFDVQTGERIFGETRVVTDANGEFTVNLWPNTRGTIPTTYLVHVVNPEFPDFYSAISDDPDPLTFFEFRFGGQPIPAEMYDMAMQLLDAFKNGSSAYIDDTGIFDYKAWSSAKIDAELALKANADSPALTGIPTAPTAVGSDRTQQIATTEFVGLLVDPVKASVDTLLTDVANLQASSATHGTNITNLQIQAGALEADVAGIHTDLDAVESNVLALQGDYSTISGTVSGINSSLTIAQSNINTLQTSVTNLLVSDAANTADIANLKQAVTNLQAEDVSTQNNIDALELRVTSAEQDIIALEAIVGGNDIVKQPDLIPIQNAITDLQGDVSAIQTDIINIGNQLGPDLVRDADIVPILTDLSNAKIDISNLQEGQTVLENRTTVAEGNISQLQSDVAALEANTANLTTIQSDVNQSKTDISTLQMEVADLQTDAANTHLQINGHESSISQLQTDVDGIKTKNTQQDTSISGIQSQLAVHSTEIGNKAEINDTNVSITATWSSDKIADYIADQIISASGINDAAISATQTWSSNKIQSELASRDTAIAGRAPAVHTHDDRYYTKSEINAALANKANVSHTHSELHSTFVLGTQVVDETGMSEGRALVSNGAGQLVYGAVVTGSCAIADMEITPTETWSSQKIDNELDMKANITHEHDARYYTQTIAAQQLALKADATAVHPVNQLGPYTLNSTNAGNGKALVLQGSELIFSVVAGSEGAPIDDSVTASVTTWSSQKITDEITSHVVASVGIDDAVVSALSTWSSDKISAEFANKADAGAMVTALADKADQSALADKADINHTHANLHPANVVGTVEVSETGIVDGHFLAYDGTSNTLKYKGIAVGDWASAKSYKVNELAVVNGYLYRCIVDHISSSFGNDLSLSRWELLSGSGGGADLSQYTAIDGGVL